MASKLIQLQSATTEFTFEFEVESARQRTASDVMVETMVNWGVKHVFGMVGHSNLGLADALRVQAEAGNLSYYGIRHEGGRVVRRFRLRQAHWTPRGLPFDRRPGRNEFADRPVGRQRGPLPCPGSDWPSGYASPRPRRISRGRFSSPHLEKSRSGHSPFCTPANMPS